MIVEVMWEVRKGINVERGRVAERTVRRGGGVGGEESEKKKGRGLWRGDPNTNGILGVGGKVESGSEVEKVVTGEPNEVQKLFSMRRYNITKKCYIHSLLKT